VEVARPGGRPITPYYDPAEDYATAVLVTGATGAIGRAVCRELVTHGYRVLGLARNAEAKARLEYGVVAVVGDIRDPAPWESAIERSDVVIHLAVPADIGQGKEEREDAERDAEELAAVLDRLCVFVRRHKKRLVNTFGSLLYEPGPDGWVRDSSPISSGRGFGIRHRKTYPVFARHRKKGLRAISVNPTFIYGSGGWFEHGVLEPMSRGQSSFIGRRRLPPRRRPSLDARRVHAARREGDARPRARFRARGDGDPDPRCVEGGRLYFLPESRLIQSPGCPGLETCLPHDRGWSSGRRP